MIVGIIPIIDVFAPTPAGTSAIWVKSAPLGYFFDVCLLVCSLITNVFAQKKIQEL